MAIVVGQGTAGITTGTYPTSFKYWIANTTTTGAPAGESVTITTASASNPRIDTIVAYVNESATFTASPVNFPTGWTAVAVAGTPNASPSAPSGATIQATVGAGNPYILLADVLVGTSVTQINTGNITDRRNMIFVTNPYKGSVCLVGAQNLAGNVATKILFDTKTYDTSSNFSLTNARMAAFVPGAYKFNATMNVNMNTTDYYYVSLYKNGTEVKRGNQQPGVSTTAYAYSSTVVGSIPMVAGDYVEVFGLQTNASARSLNPGAALTYMDWELASR